MCSKHVEKVKRCKCFYRVSLYGRFSPVIAYLINKCSLYDFCFFGWMRTAQHVVDLEKAVLYVLVPAYSDARNQAGRKVKGRKEREQEGGAPLIYQWQEGHTTIICSISRQLVCPQVGTKSRSGKSVPQIAP